MTPTEAIAMLDSQLSEHGQTISLKRTGASATCKAFVRGMRPEELVGNVEQNDRKVIFSPTGLEAFGDPAAATIIVIEGKPLAPIGRPQRVLMNDVLVRIEAMVRG